MGVVFIYSLFIGVDQFIVGFAISFGLGLRYFNYISILWNIFKGNYGKIIIMLLGVFFYFVGTQVVVYLEEQSLINNHNSILYINLIYPVLISDNRAINKNGDINKIINFMVLKNINARFFHNDIGDRSDKGVAKGEDGNEISEESQKDILGGEQDLLSLNINEIMRIFGSYENYLNCINMEVNEDLIKKYYPEYIDDFKFRSLLSILNPIFIMKVDIVIKIYKEINLYNDLSNKFILYTDFLNKEMSQVLFGELQKSRKVLIGALKELGMPLGNDLNGGQMNVEGILNSMNKNVRNKILLESSVNFKDKMEIIEGDDNFISVFSQINKIILKDANIRLIEMGFRINKDELNNHIYNIKKVTIELYTLVLFLNEINIPGYSDSWLGNLINELDEFSRKEKMESYRTKHKGERKKRISLGQVMSGYKGIIMKYHKSCSDKIVNFIIEDSNKIEVKELLDITDVVKEDIYNYQNKLYKDHKILVKELNFIFDSYKLIYDLAKNLNSKHLKNKSDKFMDVIMKNMGNKNHDELFRINKIIVDFNKGHGNIKSAQATKESLLSDKSYIFTKAKEILLEKGIDAESKQILLETFILKNEKEYVLNLIKNMDGDLSDFKLLTRIYKHSTPGYISRVEAFINNNSIREFELYNKEKDNMNKYGNQIALALFLLIKPEQLISIIFSKIIRLIGMSGGIKQTDFLDNLSKELIITLKYNSNKKENLDKLNPSEKAVVLSICQKLDSITVDSKFQFGILIMEFIMSEFDYIFVKHNIYENKENHIFLNIKQEYLAVLAGSVFNPIRLPMVAKPKKWLYSELLDDGLQLESTGGYYIDEFNELSSSNNIIRQNTFNKYDSIISNTQIETINFLNSRAFEINQEVLDVLSNDWYNKEDSKLFKGINKLHPRTDELQKLNATDKKEVMSHNSKYWNYSNILNIALLMRDQTFYFPAFLDFRGRIYPTPNYLSYQSSDLARSLLIFKNISTELSSNPSYKVILNSILKDGVYSTKIKEGEKLNQNIDYVKLYLANVYGKSKLSREKKIRWFDKNIAEMISIYESNFNSFVDQFVKESKEPFQFISIFISYYNFITFNSEIKTPILFDATCSGIQHLSALTKDIKIANLVNLLQNDSPSDFYQYCIDKILEVIADLPDVTLKNKLKQLNITRKWIKQSIMTVPYNVTTMGISDKLAEKFDKYYLDHVDMLKLDKGLVTLEQTLEKLKLNSKKTKTSIFVDKNQLDKTEAEDKDKGSFILVPLPEIKKSALNKSALYFTKAELLKFARIIQITVLNIIPPFIKLKKYFDDIINILGDLDLPFFWQTPAGMSVSMSSIRMKSHRLRQNLIKKSKPVSILIPTEQIDYKKIKLGLMPNFIHSLDASNIHILINNILKLKLENINLYTIHDCFASDYKNIAIIELLVKHSFIELYFKKDYLIEVHKSFIKQISGYTEIHEELSDGGKVLQFLLINKSNKKGISITQKVYIPDLPSFEWDVDQNKLKEEILFNTYFIC
jgi:hypothetical protein